MTSCPGYQLATNSALALLVRRVQRKRLHLYMTGRKAKKISMEQIAAMSLNTQADVAPTEETESAKQIQKIFGIVRA